MRIAVVSDIHSNLEAFEQVLSDIERSHIDKVISLGDNIGYGPDPELVLKKIQARKIHSIMGNHEMAVVDRLQLNWFNPHARRSLEKTIDLMSESSINYIYGLESSMTYNECRFIHGFPPDSSITYLFQVSDEKIKQILHTMRERIFFIGHTHLLLLMSFDGRDLKKAPLNEGLTYLSKDDRYILNIGSVGQPRDGNNNAKYVIWDSGEDTIEVRYLPYDIARVADKIYTYGFPRVHADQLW